MGGVRVSIDALWGEEVVTFAMEGVEVLAKETGDRTATASREQQRGIRPSFGENSHVVDNVSSPKL